jgi:acetyl/propionyl-CoA carboxylase alpha subunit
LKREIVIDGKQASLIIEGSRFSYRRDDNAVEREFSVEPLAPGTYSVLIGGRSYEVIASGGSIRVNGRVFSIEVFDPRGLRGRKSGAAGEGRQNVAAMMPGKVIRVLVAQGDTVEAGQGLIVVEAMKMQNEMKSPKSGRIAEVKTKPGAAVAAGEVLIVVE